MKKGGRKTERTAWESRWILNKDLANSQEPETHPGTHLAQVERIPKNSHTPHQPNPPGHQGPENHTDSYTKPSDKKDEISLTFSKSLRIEIRRKLG